MGFGAAKPNTEEGLVVLVGIEDPLPAASAFMLKVETDGVNFDCKFALVPGEAGESNGFAKRAFDVEAVFDVDSSGFEKNDEDVEVEFDGESSGFGANNEGWEAVLDDASDTTPTADVGFCENRSPKSFGDNVALFKVDAGGVAAFTFVSSVGELVEGEKLGNVCVVVMVVVAGASANLGSTGAFGWLVPSVTNKPSSSSPASASGVSSNTVISMASGKVWFPRLRSTRLYE